MQLYRFDNLKCFPVLDTFSSGCANIETAIKPWSQFGDAAKPASQAHTAAKANPNILLPSTTSNHSLNLMQISVRGFANTQPIEVVLALSAVGVAGHMEAIDLLVDSCGQRCQISIDASDVSGTPLSIDLGSTTAEGMESLLCTLGSQQRSTMDLCQADKVMTSSLVQLHRLRLCWPTGVADAQVKLASLHVYGDLRRASSVFAQR